MKLTTPTRFPGLDALRGLTIAAMIVFHFCLVYYPEPTSLPTTAIHFIGSLVGRLFLFLAGAGAWFFLKKYSPVKLLKRGLFLFILTFLIAVFLKGRYYADWSLIQDIGFCFIVIALLAQVSPHPFGLALVIYLFFFGLFVWFNFKVEGIFPIFPLAIYFLVGYGAAWLCPVRHAGPIMTKQAIFALTISLAMLVLGMLARLWALGTRFDWCAISLARNGGFMGLYLLFIHGWGHWNFEGFSGRFLILLGRVSLSTYYVQQALVVFLLTIGF